MKKIFELQKTTDKIKRFVGKDGLVAFEHGYPKPQILIGLRVYEVSMVSDKEVHCRPIYGRKVNAKVSLKDLFPNDASNLYAALLEYMFYCQTEA